MTMLKLGRVRLVVMSVGVLAVAIVSWVSMVSRESNKGLESHDAPQPAAETRALQETHPANQDGETDLAQLLHPSPEPPFSTPGSHERTLLVGDRERSYVLHVPSNYDHEKSTPLVLVFHGRLGTGRLMEHMTGFSEIADSGFIVAYPDGIGRSWNAGHGVGLAESLGVDDVGFIAQLIDDLNHELHIDLRRIYAAGMSNGGMFAYRLACELKGRIAAAASVAGPLPPEIAGNCHAAGAISVLHIHGTADQIVPWNGGETTSGGKILSVDATIQQWASADNCSDSPTVTLNKGSVECQSYRNCAHETEVSLCRVEGGGHTWPGSKPSRLFQSMVGPTNQDVNATGMIWDFFSRHPLSLEK